MATTTRNTGSSSAVDTSQCPFSMKSQKCVIMGSVVNIVVLLIAFIVYQYLRGVPSELVQTKLGSVQGTIGWSRNGNQFSQYLGIPYATHDRYEPPDPIGAWEGVWDASYYRPLCLQVESFATGFIFGDEDCLFLNVFKSHIGKASNKAVMVYIHGGIFHVGGSDFAGPKYFMDEDIILVTINYRVGSFGFLSTGDNVICGNMGLKDQQMALKWIQENIADFGGDPKKVTIFGESAGGASVHHHLLNYKSPGLFYKVIHQSGSSINYWAVYRNVKKQAERFAEKFGCPTRTSFEIANCLKRLPAKTLVSAHKEMMDFYRPQISTFVPTIESAECQSPFLTEEPRRLLRLGKFLRIPVITGVNSNEGQLVSKTVIANQTKLNEANDHWDTWAPHTLHYPEERKDVTQKLREFYFGTAIEINSTKLEQQFTDIFGDRLFIVRGAVAARMESLYTPTYFYYYDYSGVHNTGELLSNAQGDFVPNWLNIGMYIVKQWVLQFFNMMPKRTGDNACHSDEIAMLFNRDFIHTMTPSHPDYAMSSDLVKLWTAFGNDDEKLVFRNVEWRPNWNTSDFKYLRISDVPEVIPEPFEKRRLFWESLKLPNL